MSQDDLMLADRADTLTRARFGALDLRVDTKPDLTSETDADRAVESNLREALGRDRPGDSILGEEFGGTTTFSGRQWVIDPIDGTKNFVRGGAGVGQLDRVARRRRPVGRCGECARAAASVVGSARPGCTRFS